MATVTDEEGTIVGGACGEPIVSANDHRAKLLQMRAQIEEMLDETANESSKKASPREALTWMRISEFARTHRYSTKTVSQWCRLGMPHIGKGHYCRIDVRAAEAWLAADGPKRAAMNMGRLAHAKKVG